jgi:PAP2 superfamily
MGVEEARQENARKEGLQMITLKMNGKTKRWHINDREPARAGTTCARWARRAVPRLLLGLSALLLADAGWAATNNEVTKWNEIASKAAFDSGLSTMPPIESRVYALTSTAIHDALNAIDRQYRSYSLRLPASPGASPEAAVATAAHQVLADQFGRLTAIAGLPSQQTILDAAYVASLAQIPDNDSKKAGVLIGGVAASVILALRASDGWDTQPIQDFSYPQGTKPGEYRFTGTTNFAFLPQWGNLPPFILRDSSQFQPPPPLNLKSRRYAMDLNEIKSLGGDGMTTPSARTAEQTEIALFWVESTPLQWNRIARTLSGAAGLNLWQSARLFALLNLALADGYISCFHTKYYYKFWRPVTAIHEADQDGNPDTAADPMWTPLVETPAIPDYDSGHAVGGSAAAQVFERFFGKDKVTFSTCSTSLPVGQTCNDPGAVFRSYSSVSQAAEENGLARILVGFHFRHAVEEGIKRGRKVGNRVVNRFLQPVHDHVFSPSEVEPPFDEENQ